MLLCFVLFFTFPWHYWPDQIKSWVYPQLKKISLHQSEKIGILRKKWRKLQIQSLPFLSCKIFNSGTYLKGPTISPQPLPNTLISVMQSHLPLYVPSRLIHPAPVTPLFLHVHRMASPLWQWLSSRAMTRWSPCCWRTIPRARCDCLLCTSLPARTTPRPRPCSCRTTTTRTSSPRWGPVMKETASGLGSVCVFVFFLNLT